MAKKTKTRRVQSSDQSEPKLQNPNKKDDYVLVKGSVSRIEGSKRVNYDVGDTLTLTRAQAKKIGPESVKLKESAPRTEELDSDEDKS